MNIIKFIDDNIDSFESILAPMHDFIDLYKKFYDDYYYYYHSFNFHYIKNYDKCVCIIGKYSEFCEMDSFVLTNIARSYFNVVYEVFLFTTKSY